MMTRIVVSWAGVWACCAFLLACGTHENTSSLQQVEVGDGAYRVLVAHEDFSEALKWTCQRYQLNCEKVRYRAHHENYGETNAHNNQIAIFTKAFFHVNKYDSPDHSSYSDRYQAADPRTLAVIIEHENFHAKKQNQLLRIYAGSAFNLGSTRQQYTLELEAWEHNLSNLGKFNIDPRSFHESALRFFVESQVEMYAALVKNPQMRFE